MPASPVRSRALVVVLVASTSGAAGAAPPASAYPWLTDYDGRRSLSATIAVPDGFARNDQKAGSFGEWLRGLPVTPGRPKVVLFDGRPKANQAAHAAVIDIDVGTKDLQQCADAVIRLRAEYLRAAGRLAEIDFHFTSGDACPYSRWAAGERPLVSGKSVKWSRSADPDQS